MQALFHLFLMSGYPIAFVFLCIEAHLLLLKKCFHARCCFQSNYPCTAIANNFGTFCFGKIPPTISTLLSCFLQTKHLFLNTGCTLQLCTCISFLRVWFS